MHKHWYHTIKKIFKTKVHVHHIHQLRHKITDVNGNAGIASTCDPPLLCTTPHEHILLLMIPDTSQSIRSKAAENSLAIKMPIALDTQN